MSDRNRLAPTRSGGPPARTPWPAPRSRGAPFASWSFPGSPAARNRAIAGSAPTRAWDGAAMVPDPGWREPFALLVLAVASLGAVLLLSGVAAVPADGMMF